MQIGARRLGHCWRNDCTVAISNWCLELILSVVVGVAWWGCAIWRSKESRWSVVRLELAKHRALQSSAFMSIGCWIVLSLSLRHKIFCLTNSLRTLTICCERLSSQNMPVQHCNNLLGEDFDMLLLARTCALLIAIGGHCWQTIFLVRPGQQSDLHQ